MRARLAPLARALPLAVAALAALTVTGCYNFATPSYRPVDASQLVTEISRRGATVDSAVSGDPACPDPSLAGNALHLRLSTPDEPTIRDAYVFIFREKSWNASAATVDACQAAFALARPGATIDRLDIPIYRAIGADWSPSLRALMVDALTQASQGGDPDQ